MSDDKLNTTTLGKNAGRKPKKAGERKLTKKQAIRALQVYAARTGAQTLIDDNFPQQAAFIRDPSKLKAALCTRRAGKSYGIGLYLFQEALNTPNSICMYVGLTRDTAKRTMWKPILQKINDKHALGAVFKEVELSVHLSNGSIIYLIGMNTTSDEQEKIRGNAYKLVVLDECASFTQDLRQIVHDVIQPAMTDHDGTICLVGTPGNLIQLRRKAAFGQALATGEAGEVAAEFSEEKLAVEKPLFYAVTTGEETGWSVHKWTGHDNPYTCKNFQKLIDAIIQQNPSVVETPRFKQEWQGEWFIDTSRLVYRFDANKNTIDSLPGNPLDYTYLLGMDLGWTDPSAFVVGAYSKHDECLYIVEVFKKTGMLLSAVEKKIKELQAKYPISKFIIDSRAKQSVEEIKARTGLPLMAAEQVNKVDFIQMMNNDLIAEKVKVLMPFGQSLVDEWQALIWDTKFTDKLVEHKACANHCVDSALYTWRYAYNYLAKPKVVAVEKNTEGWMDQWWEQEAHKISRKKQESHDWLSNDWKDTFQ